VDKALVACVVRITPLAMLTAHLCLSCTLGCTITGASSLLLLTLLTLLDGLNTLDGKLHYGPSFLPCARLA